MNWEMTAALGAAGTCAGAGTAWLLAETGAAVPVLAVTFGTALVWSSIAAMGMPVSALAVPLVVTGLAVPLIAADLRHRRLPDVLTLPAYPLLIAVAPNPVKALTAATVFGGLHLLVHLAAPHAMGAGDVKLAGALGAALGWSAALPVTAALAALITATLAATRHWPDGVPHGPGLSAAATALVLLRPG